ncbi:MAG: DUF2877 domain-containing protein [Chlamydiota bacterium]
MTYSVPSVVKNRAVVYHYPVMRLRAVSIDRELGDALRRGIFRGAVLSVHRNAAYLETDDGSLIALAREEVGNGPGFVLLPRVAAFPEGIVPSGPFTAEGGLISLGGGRIAVETGGAAAWDAVLRPRAGSPVRDIGECARAALGLAAARCRGLGLCPLVGAIAEIAEGRSAAARAGECAFTEVRVRLFADAVFRGDGAADAARALIGLGDGLTPSCDDMLVGLAGIFHGISADPRSRAWARGILGGLREAIGEAGGRTTPVSAHFLRAAARGRFTERAKGLIEAVLGADEKRVASAAERVLEYGAASGADLIFGVTLAGLIVSRRQKEES